MTEDKVLNDESFCVLLCGERVFKIDKQQLIRKSSYFSAMIAWNATESSSNQIELHDVEPDTLDAILNFIQSAEIPQLQGNEDELLAMLSTSHMFMMSNLFNSCCCQLSSILQTNNLPEMLILNTLFESKEFSRELFTFTALHFNQLKETLIERLSFNEMKLFLPYVEPINMDASSYDLLEFVMQWIKRDLQFRQENLIQLISLVSMKNLTDEELNRFLHNENIFKYSRIARNSLIEKASIDQLHLILKSLNELEIYNIATESFIEKLKVSYCYTLLNPFYFQNSFYSVAYKRKYKEFATSLSVFQHDRENNIQIIHEIGRVKGRLHTCSIHDSIYIISCQGRNWNQGPYKIKIQSFHFASKRVRTVAKKAFLYEVTDICSSHFHIYMLNKNQHSHFDSIICFDVNSQEWCEIPNPPTTSVNCEEFAACCLDQLYVMRFKLCFPHPPPNNDKLSMKLDVLSLNFESKVWKMEQAGRFDHEMVGFIQFQNRNIKIIPFLYLALNNGKILQFNIISFETKEIQKWNPHEHPRYFNVFCK